MHYNILDTHADLSIRIRIRIIDNWTDGLNKQKEKQKKGWKIKFFQQQQQKWIQLISLV